jgi:phosphohistidine phosphatase
MIFLMRHADAISDEVDPVRPLSPRGREQVARVCELLRPVAEFAPDEIWHSPLARSRETAALLAAGLKLAAPLEQRPGLEPDDDPRKVATILDAQERAVAVVGHEPLLGVLASLMVHGPRPGVYYPFPKAAVLALTRGPGTWRSQWLVRSV